MCTSLVLLSLSSCEKTEPIEPNETKNEGASLIVSNCTNEINEANGVGVGSEIAMTAITKITFDKLMKNGSDTIRALRFGIFEGGTNCKAFIRESLNGANVVTVPFKFVSSGWNVVELPKGYKVEEGDDLFIGYEITSDNFAIAYNGNNKSEDKIGINKKWTDLYAVTKGGDLCIQAIVTGGDYSAEPNKYELDVYAMDIPNSLAVGETFEPKAYITNNGIYTVKSFEINGTYNGEAYKREFKDFNLKAGYSTLVSLGAFTAANSKDIIKFTGELKALDVTETDLNNNKFEAEQITFEGYHPLNMVLLEQFTGQACPNCPNGSKSLAEAIKGSDNPEQFCWVAHHDGYYTDSFTIKESSTITKSLGINGAPSLSINRAKYNSKLFTHPGYIKSRDLNKVAKIGSSSTIEMKHTYDKATRELKVTVSGECNEIAANITVLIMQSGIKATQAGGGADYEHNFAPRAFLTAAMGDKLELKDRKYSKSYTLTVPEKVGDYNVVLENVDVVSFITRNGRNAKNSPVLNTDMAPLIEGASSVNATDILRNYFEQTPEFSILKYCRQ